MSDELTVSNPCYQCMIQMELCVDCQDIRETRATIFAHDLVDEGSDIYRYAPMYTSLTKIEPEPSGHEWVGAVTLDNRDQERLEFMEPVTNLSDRIFELEVELTPHEMVCQSCRLVCNKHAVCPNCN